MPFKKWTSLENHYQEKQLQRWVWNQPSLDHLVYEVTEKIHGANFSILVEDKQVFFCRRSGIIPEGEKFYGYKELVNTFEFQMLIKHLCYLNTLDITTIQLFGELFGPGVQKGVYYGDTLQFRWYALEINGLIVPPNQVANLLKDFLQLKVPVIDRIQAQGFMSMIDSINTKFNSLLTPEGYDKPNICEGVVITPLETVIADPVGAIVIVKKKNDEFKEIQSKPKRAKVASTLSDEAQAAQETLLSYVNDMRTQSVFSKLGPLEDMKKIGDYARDYHDDVITDVTKDHPGIFNLDKQEVSAIRKKLSSEIFQELRKQL